MCLWRICYWDDNSKYFIGIFGSNNKDLSEYLLPHKKYSEVKLW